ncbi:hypothetical protein [Streptomyces cylindrosporus]|uniref:Uncharacterized protein n=1 Tax=Streptomyces cylindrosporus TaxID=2927583 RepID=A0ABS9YJR6_9ACTN|nr:hypothetical protein [Streptomyces cylindrosporus]MCI3277490.1 hypothetical protein [Streptomyces cylindrosporus]
MPELPFPATDPQSFDLDTASNAIGEATLRLVKLTFREPGTLPSAADGRAFMESLRGALTAGSAACSEVTRIRGELTVLRDGHRPQPHADPTKPGALCAACSVHGSIVAWPCATWSAAERILTHGKA